MSIALQQREGWVRMLKISLVDGPHQRRMIVEGMLVAPWTAELTAACETARADLEGREFIVDLRGLIAIGPEGENVLLQLLKDKVRLQCGVFARELLRQLVRDTYHASWDHGEILNNTDSESKSEDG